MPNLTGLRERRQRTGVKVGEFAKKVDYARSTFISIENGTRPASPEGIERIAQTLTDLGVPTTAKELVDGTVPDEPPKQPKRPPAPPPRRTKEKTGPKRAQAKTEIDEVAGRRRRGAA